ncbi:hypothetical protein KIL84_006749 [Mauremys mutica]|uniref:Uncharacterized protein n=1 Tax=Mauremys mutica TaxID=74926 RepID=A0A9D3X1I1_9SAUR|nr:hypothetical protein KIL84_006749 [Mauremys mutica]
MQPVDFISPPGNLVCFFPLNKGCNLQGEGGRPTHREREWLLREMRQRNKGGEERFRAAPAGARCLDFLVLKLQSILNKEQVFLGTHCCLSKTDLALCELL